MLTRLPYHYIIAEQVRENKRNKATQNGILAQLGEHLPYKQRVIGSSPITSTNPNLKRTTFECRVLGFFLYYFY